VSSSLSCCHLKCISIMKTKYDREIAQLWWVSEQYFQMSEKVMKKLNKKDLRTKVKELGDRCEDISRIKDTDKLLVMLNAHLASCSVRLFTIDEKIKSMRCLCYKKLKKMNHLEESNLRKNLDKIVHYLLRHNLAHPEEWSNYKKQYNIMQKTFMNLTIYELYENVKLVRGAIINEITL